MNLKHGSMLVAEYKQKFNELLEFAPLILAISAGKCKKFQDGLYVSIQDRLTILDTDDLSKWLNMVVKAEQNLKEMIDKEEV